MNYSMQDFSKAFTKAMAELPPKEPIHHFAITTQYLRATTAFIIKQNGPRPRNSRKAVAPPRVPGELQMMFGFRVFTDNTMPEGVLLRAYDANNKIVGELTE